MGISCPNKTSGPTPIEAFLIDHLECQDEATGNQGVVWQMSTTCFTEVGMCQKEMDPPNFNMSPVLFKYPFSCIPCFKETAASSETFTVSRGSGLAVGSKLPGESAGGAESDQDLGFGASFFLFFPRGARVWAWFL